VSLLTFLKFLRDGSKKVQAIKQSNLLFPKANISTDNAFLNNKVFFEHVQSEKVFIVDPT